VTVKKAGTAVPMPKRMGTRMAKDMSVMYSSCGHRNVEGYT
jgi:hypothetical protein